jgi:hypothetical protein
MRSRGRVLDSPQYIEGFRDALREARADLDKMHQRHAIELGRLYGELERVRSALDELRSVALAREKATVELAELRRLREISKANMVQRDISTPLH